MLHLPRPSTTHVARPRAPSTAGSTHSSDRSPSPTASSAPPPTLSSPASSFAPLAGVGAGPAHLPPGRQGGWRPYIERQPILVRGPRRDTKRIDEMSLDELNENLSRNARVLSDRSIFPPRRPSSPPDPHRQKLVAMQAQLEERMSLLTTQDGVANLSVDGISPGTNSDFGLGQSPEQGIGSYRRLSTQTSPVFRNPTPRKTGRTDPLGMDEALALQSALFERERAREQARQEALTLREEQRIAASLGLGNVTGARLQDELERIRAAARMRAFMNPKQSYDVYSDDEVEPLDDLTAAFEADDDGFSDDEGDGNGGASLMVISQEEMERSWEGDGGEGTTG